MNEIDNKINTLKDTVNADVNWQLIKDIVCGIAVSITAVANAIPAGIIRTMLLGVSSLLSMVCSQIPGTH